MNELILTLCFGVAAFILALALYVEIRSKMRNIEVEQKALNERVKKLEEANPKRINYQSLEEIENAMSELVVLEMEHDLRAERITSIKAHLSRAHTPNKK